MGVDSFGDGGQGMGVRIWGSADREGYSPANGGPASVDMPRVNVIKPKEEVSLSRPSTSTRTMGERDTWPPVKLKNSVLK